MKRALLVAAVSVAALGSVTSAHATGAEDFADAVKDATGDYNRAWVLTKLTTFKLGAKCWAKVVDKKHGAIHSASFTTRDIVDYAKTVTGEDWSDLETQNNNDRENNKALLEPKMNAFKARHMITINVDGDDCDAKQSSLWLGYWGAVTGGIKNFPPPAGKSFFTINVSSKIKDVTVEVSKDGSTFTINAPKDRETKQWQDKIERPLRKLHLGITDDFAFGLKETTGDVYSAWILTKLHRFKLGKKCTARLADKELGALHAASFATRDIADYAKSSAGAEDWDAIEGQSANDKETNLGMVAKDMDAFAKRFSLTIAVEGDDCDLKQSSLWLRYWTTVATALRDYPPKAKKVAITLNVTAKAKQVTATAGKDGATVVITAPRDKEGTAWSDKIADAFKKVSKHKK